MRALDSDAVIDILRGYEPALDWFAFLPTEGFTVSGYVLLELIQGTRNRREMSQLLRIAAPWPIYCPSSTARYRALGDLAEFHLTHRLGAFDSLIAQTAIELNAILCTFSVRHFQPVPGLVTERPYDRQ
jgi:predicted nucleic acid-binding protein